MPAGHIFALSSRLRDLSPQTRREIERAFIDTYAVLCAGWDEPGTRALRDVYSQVASPWSSARPADPEQSALVWGTAAHALDYDDCHMTSVTHPSAVLIPAIEAAAALVPGGEDRKASAFALGLAVNVGLGDAMGFAHYASGWHATSTIGAVAAGAAVAHLLGLDERAFRSALAIAAAQAGGLQRNFGSMVKPLQAGLAARAGVCAGRLASAGIVGPDDVLSGPNGFLSAFGGEGHAALDLDVDTAIAGISRKLFACCYMAHRPVAAAILLHRQGAGSILADPSATVEVEVPPGCLKALVVDIPTTGSEAKFSGRYTVAHALLTGHLGLSAFLPESVGRDDILALCRRITLTEVSGDAAAGIDRGSVTVSLRRGGEIAASQSVAKYPGSPASPMSDAELDGKLIDCLSIGRPNVDLASSFRAMAKQFAGIA